MRKQRKKPKGSCRILRAAFAAIFAASYVAAIAWVHGHFCRIEGSSMEPSYRDKDIVYTETLPEGTFPALGDVVILDMPSDGENKLSFLPWRTLITKRVVGVPGDLIEIREDGLYRNGDFIE
ncbi:MAG: signal peptidase I, partial [Eubacteriales bacterium]